MAIISYAAFVQPGLEKIFVFSGLMKVLISFVKYLPQVYLNWYRKTTTGWSLENVLLDLVGGVLSFIQIFIDWADSGATSQFSGGLNIAKFLLAIVCILFDGIFLFQHYVLYNPAKRKAKGSEADYSESENIKQSSA